MDDETHGVFNTRFLLVVNGKDRTKQDSHIFCNILFSIIVKIIQCMLEFASATVKMIVFSQTLVSAINFTKRFNNTVFIT